MAQWLETATVAENPDSDVDVLGSDMIAYMAAQTQKEDAIERPGGSLKKRKPPSTETAILACANKTCETHVQKRFRLYKKGNSRSKERYCKRHAEQRTSDNYVEAEYVNR